MSWIYVRSVLCVNLNELKFTQWRVQQKILFSKSPSQKNLLLQAVKYVFMWSLLTGLQSIWDPLHWMSSNAFVEMQCKFVKLRDTEVSQM